MTREPLRGAEPHSVAVVSLLIVLTVMAGCTNYSLPLYLEHLTQDRGLPLGGVSAGTTVFFLCGAVVAVPMGRVLEHVEPRLVMLVGGLVGGVSLASLGQVTTLPSAYVCYAGLGSAFMAAGALPASTAILRLAPEERRGPLLAVSSAGLSAGGFVITPLAVLLIDQLGLGTATVILGVLYAGSTVLVMVFLMPSAKLVAVPERVPPAAPDAATAQSLVSASARAAATQRRWLFWLLVLAFSCFFAAQIGATTHLVRLAGDRGVAHGTWLLPALTMAALGGRAIGSFALSRLSIWTVVTGVFLVEGAANATLALATDQVAMFIGAILLGVAIGHTPIVIPLSLVEAFGVADYPRTASVFQLLTAVGLGAGPILVSVVHDSFDGAGDGYRAGYLLLMVLNVVGAVVLRSAVRFTRRDPG